MSSGPHAETAASIVGQPPPGGGDDVAFASAKPRSRRGGQLFGLVCLVAAWFGVLVLSILLVGTVIEAWGWLDWQFLTGDPKVNDAENSGARPAVWGTLWLILLTGVLAIPVGVGAAVYIEEFAPDNWFRKFVQINLANLAGVPSVVYGLLGLTVFVRMFGVIPDDQQIAIPPSSMLEWPIPLTDSTVRLAQVRIPLPFGRTVISGAMTMALLILPVIIVASQEALRAVPPSIRHASLALGATKWQTIRRQVLPAGAPGILTGVILSISRAIGETAPLIILGAATFIPRSPGGIETIGDLVSKPDAVVQAPFDNFTTMTLQIYSWIEETDGDYKHVTAAGILVVLAVLLVLNSLAVLIRNRFQRYVRW